MYQHLIDLHRKLFAALNELKNCLKHQYSKSQGNGKVSTTYAWDVVISFNACTVFSMFPAGAFCFSIISTLRSNSGFDKTFFFALLFSGLSLMIRLTALAGAFEGDFSVFTSSSFFGVASVVEGRRLIYDKRDRNIV